MEQYGNLQLEAWRQTLLVDVACVIRPSVKFTSSRMLGLFVFNSAFFLAADDIACEVFEGSNKIGNKYLSPYKYVHPRTRRTGMART